MPDASPAAICTSLMQGDRSGPTVLLDFSMKVTTISVVTALEVAALTSTSSSSTWTGRGHLIDSPHRCFLDWYFRQPSSWRPTRCRRHGIRRLTGSVGKFRLFVVGVVSVSSALAAPAIAAQDDLDLVSRASGATGAKAEENADQAAISADGRFVAFRSPANNLHDDDADSTVDVYVRDLQTNTTALVSRATGATGTPGNNTSDQPAISADGRFVAFTSTATNLHPDDTDGVDDVFVRDLQDNTTALVSRAAGATGVKSDGQSRAPSISADGGSVAFRSSGANLHPDDTDGTPDIFLRGLQTNTTTLVSRATGATGAKGSGASGNPAISADGSSVAFESGSTNLHPDDTDTTLDVFVRGLQTNTTTLVSRATGVTGAKGSSSSDLPAISANGRFVAFHSASTNLHPDGSDTTRDVFLRDLQADTTTLVSRAAGATGADGNNDSTTAAISDDGAVRSVPVGLDEPAPRRCRHRLRRVRARSAGQHHDPGQPCRRRYRGQGQRQLFRRRDLS